MAVPQQFCVRWNSHLGSLGAAFPQLLAGGRFVDVTLACEGRQLSCHRLVLAACSAFFESLLGENPCKHPIIILKDVRFWELQALVDFMYKGEVNVTQDGLQDLLKCAETLQIRGLSGADSAFKNLPLPAPITPKIEFPVVKSPKEEPNIPEAPIPTVAPPTPIQNNDIPENDNSPDSSSVRSDDMLDDDEMKLVIKEEYCIEEELHTKQEPLNTGVYDVKDTSKEQILDFKNKKIKPEPIDIENNIDFLENLEFYCPPQLKYNKDVMAIIPKGSSQKMVPKKEMSMSFNSDFQEDPIFLPLRVEFWSENEATIAEKAITERFKQAKSNTGFKNTDNVPRHRGIRIKNVAKINMAKSQLLNDIEAGRNRSNKATAASKAMGLPPMFMPQTGHGFEGIHPDLGKPPIFIRSNRNGAARTYNKEALWKALMDIKGGSSIYRASQVYNVPRKTLRNWMKRWDIKSSYPMPRQLRQFVDNKKKITNSTD